jgi:NAD(P)-dependent dehydrogenase (short-subunit alcohol dehydrogenase family)
MAIDNDVPRIWLISGVSPGLGLAFAQAALTAGHTVVGTVRSESDRVNFENTQRGRAHAMVLDVSDFASIGPAVTRVQQAIGAIDVLINNAGFGHEGTLEESPLDELRRQFDFLPPRTPQSSPCVYPIR